MSDQLDLNKLRAVAEAATPGPWHHAETGVLGAREDWDLGKGPARIMVAQMPWRRERMEANAKHVATFDPPTVLALLSRLEQAERNADTYQTLYEQRAESLEQAEQQVARVRAMAEEMGEAIGFDRLVHGSEAEYPVSYFRDKLEEALDGEQGA